MIAEKEILAITDCFEKLQDALIQETIREFAEAKPDCMCIAHYPECMILMELENVYDTYTGRDGKEECAHIKVNLFSLLAQEIERLSKADEIVLIKLLADLETLSWRIKEILNLPSKDYPEFVGLIGACSIGETMIKRKLKAGSREDRALDILTAVGRIYLNNEVGKNDLSGN